jgi:hypothetical protein
VTNPSTAMSGNGTALGGPTVSQGQLLLPYSQYNGAYSNALGAYDSIYHSLQVSAQKRFASGGTLLVAYTNAKLISDTDTLTSWLESGSGFTGSIQDNYNLRGERSLSSQDVSQRLVYLICHSAGARNSSLGQVEQWASLCPGGAWTGSRRCRGASP